VRVTSLLLLLLLLSQSKKNDFIEHAACHMPHVAADVVSLE
jgi:hypothetical protein